MDPHALTPQARSRLRPFAEGLTENSSLRDHLNDAQAQQLLDWGLTHLQKVAAGTEDMAADEAQPILEREAERVRDIMRRINQVAARLPPTAGDESNAALQRLITAIAAGQRDGVRAAVDKLIALTAAEAEEG